AGPERAEPPAQAVPRRKAGSTNARSNRIPGARKDTGRALHVRTAPFDPVEFTTEIFLQHTQVWEHALLERGREYGDQITRLSKSGQQHLEEGVQVDLSRLVAFPLLQRARERVLGCRPKRKGMPAFVGTSHGPPIREEPPDSALVRCHLDEMRVPLGPGKRQHCLSLLVVDPHSTGLSLLARPKSSYLCCRRCRSLS